MTNYFCLLKEKFKMNEQLFLTIIQIKFNTITNLLLGIDLRKPLILFSEWDKSYESFFKELSQDWLIEEETDFNRDQLKMISEKLQSLIVLECVQKDSRVLQEWSKTLPKHFRTVSLEERSKNAEFRRLLFESYYFQQKKEEAFVSAIERYNSTYYSFLSVQISLDKSVDSMTSLILQNQSETRTILKQGFTGLAIQNADLLKQNQELKEELQSLRKELQSVSQILKEKLEAERLLEEKRQRVKNRKRLPKREPITLEYYEFILSEAQSIQYRTYHGARLRLALALLLVTGVRIAELLPLRMKQIQTLFEESWIAIDRIKRGPANHKAFLTKEGKKILKDRKEDLKMISYFKKEDSYIFTPENSDKPLERESFTALVNQFLKKCAEQIEGKPNLRSHSFRIGYINKLWKDTKDIEFVRQTIGHAKVDTTSMYMDQLSDAERQRIILSLPSSISE